MSDRRSLPERPDLRRLRAEAKTRRRAGEYPSLALAQLALAREHGFASWPRLKLHVEARTLEAGVRAERLVRSACSGNVRRARALLEADAALARHDLACACVAGEAAEVARRLAAAPDVAQAATGPLERAPILYACFSRLGRTDSARAGGIRAVVDGLLAAGADPDARYENQDGWVQSTLYGAAGIAGDPALTATLLAAGADPNDDDPVHTVGEALYHACEHPDPECARLLIAAGTKPHVVAHCLGRALNFPNVAMVRTFCEGGARATGDHLDQAVSRRRGAETVELLLDAGAPVDGDPDGAGPTPLQVAVRWDEADVAALLLARGADPDRVSDADRALGAFLGGRVTSAASPIPAGGGAAREPLDQLFEVAIDQGDLAATRRLLDAGAALEGDPDDEFRPIGVAAWRGRAAIVAELAARGAALAFPEGGSAVGAALHGSRHCQHPEGGPTMGTIDEVDRSRYRDTVRALLAAGASVPERLEDGPSSVSLLAELGLDVPCAGH